MGENLGKKWEAVFEQSWQDAFPIVIIKDGQLKCIGEKNLNKYLTVGWEIYKKGNGGKIQHGR